MACSGRVQANLVTQYLFTFISVQRVFKSMSMKTYSPPRTLLCVLNENGQTRPERNLIMNYVTMLQHVSIGLVLRLVSETGKPM